MEYSWLTVVGPEVCVQSAKPARAIITSKKVLLLAISQYLDVYSMHMHLHGGVQPLQFLA